MLKTLRKRLEEKAKESKIRLEVIEKDYLLSWVLAGIYQDEKLRSELVFKGGTALKKCYFGQYRFSEDLDFTTISKNLRGTQLEECIINACDWAERSINEYSQIKVVCERYREKKPHPDGQEAFSIYAQYSWQRQPLTKVMIEITNDEDILTPIEKKVILHDYGEELNQTVFTYSLEEVVAEKLRAILQHTKKLHERDWTRSRARDYYDLWRIFRDKQNLQLGNLEEYLRKKCSYKEVCFNKVEDFFNNDMMEFVQRTWVKWLGNLVPDLPESKIVIDELRVRLNKIMCIQGNR